MIDEMLFGEKEPTKKDRLFWTVFAKLKNGKTKIVEIEAGSDRTAIQKGYQFYPDAVRVLISL